MEAPEKHEGGPVLGPAATTVHLDDKHAARVSDLADCKPEGLDDVLAQGAATVLIEGLCAARKDDATAHEGAITEGLASVLIGGAEFKARKVTLVLDPATGEWQMRYGSAIVIRPDLTRPKFARDETFQTRALQSLIRLDATPTMHGALDGLEATGRTVTIERYRGGYGPGQAEAEAVSSADAYPLGAVVNDGSVRYLGTGRGTDSTVRWSPDVHTFDDPAGVPLEWARPGADVILGHELLHGLQMATGTTPVGPGESHSVLAEREVVGADGRFYGFDLEHLEYLGAFLPATRNRPFTENRLRADYRDRGIASPATGRPPLDRPSYATDGEPF